MSKPEVSLDDKYAIDSGSIYISGSQALVRLPMMQLARDRAAGLDTACFISGYRGSPMHNYDKELWRAGRFLDGARIHFQPAVNEDLAATSLWGAQLASTLGAARHDGVFGIWYGKGPGLDRSVDAIRHANHAGTSPHGGVLAIVGDDHAMASTDVPATCEPTFIDLMMPVLYPGSVQELLELGLMGIALSRYCGAWVGIKAVSDTLDAVASVSVDARLPHIVLPEDFGFPADGVHIREPDPWHLQEARQRRVKMGAALAFARANRLNRVTWSSPQPRYGIIASGKCAFDVNEALREIGLDPARAAALGIVVFQVSMPFPLDAAALREFADGLQEVLVVEEKRRIVETALKDALYSLPDGRRPRVVGRRDERGDALLPEVGEIAPEHIVRALAARLGHLYDDPRLAARVAALEAGERQRHALSEVAVRRSPYFCSGCPHSSSTRVPAGSIALGGVGCHFMATNMERDNLTHTHMGGEGAIWIGMAPFVERQHVFQNLGDGTYFHSGLLAIRACVAAGVNITYKILFNDAVAMTGGQPVDGVQTPATIAAQVRAEGVHEVVVVSDDPARSRAHVGYPAGVGFEHRDALDAVQARLREVGGVSVIVYDQTCAAEKRRRRKRGELVDPERRVFINQRVCEGCGDCSQVSNCLSVVPVDTPFGRKRRIDQSSCNKDYSCLKGFCPSFVTVRGGRPRRRAASQAIPASLRLLPEPQRPVLAPGHTFNVLVTGIGGTGVVTVGAMLTMAAHLEGKACSSVDQFGMAQKGGAVTSHVRIAPAAADIHAVRLTDGSADLLLGCDSLVAASDLALRVIDPQRTRVIVNTHEAITGQFTRDPDLGFPAATLAGRLRACSAPERLDLVDATGLATALLGDAIATNLFMLGFAYQRGALPVSASAIEAAIELNAVAVEGNKSAFAWGRRAALDPSAVAAAVAADGAPAVAAPDLDALIDARAADLADYQDDALAMRYRALVTGLRNAERAALPGTETLSRLVAAGAYRLMAVKDEYEVARLYTDGYFERAVAAAFEGDLQIEFHLAPPVLARFDAPGARPRKRRFGPWMLGVLRVLARLRRWRGSAVDPFRFNPERRLERDILARYETVVGEIAAGLTPANHAAAGDLLGAFDAIRGYGHVKQASASAALNRVEALRAGWAAPPPATVLALRRSA